MVAKERALNFLSLVETNKPNVYLQMNTAVAQRIQKNRQVVKSVAKCKQIIALRGHRDDSKHLGKGTNAGNFHALIIDFRLDAGDRILKEHLVHLHIQVQDYSE